jgi:voltage-gated potassium channel
MAHQTAAADRESERPAELQAPGYEIFIGLLAVISLINLAIVVLAINEYTKQIAQIVDVPITLIFLGDFSMRLLRSHPRRTYFIEQRGWLDLLGSLPAGFRLFRIFRLVRVFRLLQAYGFRNIIRSFIKERANNALLVVLFMVIVVIEFGGMLVVHFEAPAVGANITTGGDAVWWAFVSITTVGYGDKFPITEGGRISAFLVLAAGVGLFGVLSGYLANFFLAPAAADEEPAEPVASEPQATTGAAMATAESDDTALLRMVDELEVSVAALRARLAERTDRLEPG